MRSKSNAAEKAEPSYRDLPFIVNGAWSPDRPASYTAANALGSEYAEAMLTMIRETRNPLTFGAVIQAMQISGVYEGVEVGFCHRIGLHLVG